ncbi:MAG: thioredoxin domain-containing protein, partial [Candidatus Omnitrophica bacterium]|nr:thioredoxin domain-containing protein [Candidatus Omnitrophota bacterium]
MSEKNEMQPKYTNHLIDETSPYLLQHAHNPVDWRPWGEDALRKAREEDKPIFLSIGYSACHWCHVMEHESFENEEIAKFLNKHFISIKVDREERPDLDEIYMTATQMISGSGGWPMSVFLTPDLKPFYAGTYFPPDARYGRPGFRQILEALADAYVSRREEVNRNAENVTRTINGYLAAEASSATLSEKIIPDAVETLKNRFDPVYGGFGGAPKFPHTMDLMLLMRHYKGTEDAETLRMVTESLDKMARGGMYDQLGGGFHRYSVDAEWLIPHFEKMLYDNALLATTYLEGFQLTGDDRFKTIAREILDYVIREMQSEEGGYYSSTDADSEGEEGKYFVWTPSEIEEALGEKDARVFCEFYDVREGGNFEHGTSALSIPKTTAEVAEGLGLTVQEVNEVIDRSKPKLLEIRSKRVPPGLDDKILVDWNGLMISAMAFGSFVLDDPRYAESAKKAAEALLEHQWNGERLLHTRRNGRSHLEGLLSDYSNLVYGLTDLFLATQESKWLERAIQIHQKMVELFEDPDEGGFFNTLGEQTDLIIRTKSGTDNAVPSGNSIAAINSVRLSSITGNPELEKQAERTLL